MGRVLAIDYGKKRTGLAVSDPLRLTANPLLTIETPLLMAWITQELAKGEVDTVVIGHPTQMNGQDSESMTYIRPFMNWFHNHFPQVPLVPYDERFTSVLAHKAMLDAGLPKHRRQEKAVVDRLAACIILEDYLSTL